HLVFYRNLECRMLGRVIVIAAGMLMPSLSPSASICAEVPPLRFSRQVLTDQYYCDGVSMGDINADGHTDIVAGPFWYEGPAFVESHAFYEPVALPREPSPSNSMFSFVHDLNGDSWPDIVVLGRVHKHEAKWFENPGNRRKLDASSIKGGPEEEAEYWTSHFMFDRVRGESPTLVDIDGDGGPELICHWEGRWGWIAPQEGEPYAAWTFHAIGEDEGWPQFYHGEGVGDINGDGRLDLVINDGWYEQPDESKSDGGAWHFHRHRFSQERGGAQMFVNDVDGDGDADVISAIDAHGWGLAWYEQREGVAGARFLEHLLMGDRSQEENFGVAFTQPHALELVDINDDGHKDIVTGKRRWAHGPTGDIEPSAAPVVYWFEWTTDDSGTPRYVPHLIDDESGVGVQILVADVDGDSRTDVVTASKLGTFVFRNLHEADPGSAPGE
ncbi:MAG: FG-GAP repeat domain-containing protein, partial [Rubripirellula sp.]